MWRIRQKGCCQPVGCKNFWKQIWSFRQTIIMIGTPLVFSFIPIAWPSSEANCAYIMIWMAVYWMLEIFPMAITSLLPVVLFPMFGIMNGEEVAKNYMKDSQMLFIGGLTMAVAVEHVNLHKRIALRVLTLVGSEIRWLLMGFMGVTFFLSMWISNTATTAMMLPITIAVLEQLMQTSKYQRRVLPASTSSVTLTSTLDNDVMEVTPGLQRNKSTVSTTQLVQTPTEENAIGEINLAYVDTDVNSIANDHYEVEAEDLEQPAQPKKTFNILPGKTQNIDNLVLCKCLLISIAYSANMGGTGTLTGTTPNLVLAGQVETLYPVPEAAISFTGWMFFTLPNALLCLLAGWAWLQLYFFGYKALFGCCGGQTDDTRNGNDKVKSVIRQQYDALGPMSFQEKVVLFNFALLVALWLSRVPNIIPGWGALFTWDGETYATDGTAAMFVVMLLFVFPSERPNFFCLADPTDISKKGPKPTVIFWSTIHEKLPWSVVFLMGGGYALAAGVQESGLSQVISQLLVGLKDMPPWLIVMLLCFMIASLTEVASNTATATIMIPILAELADTLCIHPYYFLFPAVISASYAFMLPVATPPNAIVFTYDFLKISDMAKVGVVMNVLCVLIVTLVVNTYGKWVFGWGTFPEWAASDPINHQCFPNATAPSNVTTAFALS